MASKHARLDRLDPIERDRDVSQEDNRVTVGLVHRDPRERPTIALGPLGEQGGLAVPGRARDRHDGGRLGARDARRVRCAARSPVGRGSEELGLRDLERATSPPGSGTLARRLVDRPTPHRRDSLALPASSCSS
jgi:hypothetical protein